MVSVPVSSGEAFAPGISADPLWSKTEAANCSRDMEKRNMRHSELRNRLHSTWDGGQDREHI